MKTVTVWSQHTISRMCSVVFLLILAFWTQKLSSQSLNSKYANNTLVSFEKEIYNSDSIFHTSIKPYLLTDFKRAFDYDSVFKTYLLKEKSGTKGTKLNLIFNRSLFSVQKADYGFTINPLFDFSYGKDYENKHSEWVNTRGFLIEGYIGNNFAFSTQFYETQSKVPLWVEHYLASRQTMPGQGSVKSFGKDAYDFANASGYISWTPGKYFNFQFGQGKHFWGDGYRSLILSDFSLYHPYFMITTTFWKIKYVNLYSQLSHPDIIEHRGLGDVLFSKKFSTMHYLSYIPWKKFNISVFESIIWQAEDSTYYRGYEFSYLNPVIFFRPVEFNLGSGDNEMIGFNARYSPFKKLAIYGQFVIDEFRIKEMTSNRGWSGNKYGWQLGLKSFDLLGIENLNLQAEANLIRPYMYSHYTQVQNYSNARESLAHPSGANIKEAVAIVKYNYRRLYFNLKYVWSGFGLDSDGINYGKSIFNNPQKAPYEYGIVTGQGKYTNLNQFDATVSILINPSTNANFYFSTTYRKEQNSTMRYSYTLINFGFRTSLRNLYYDFF